MSETKAGQFPATRLRRSRRTDALRRLVAETSLSAADFIYPVFVLDGEGREEAIPSMPGIFRRSIDGLLKELEQVVALGIPAIALFPVIEADKKSLDGSECANPDGLVQRTVAAIKQQFPELAIMSDVALVFSAAAASRRFRTCTCARWGPSCAD